MLDTRSHNARRDLSALEAAATSARAGFACMFSTSDEYEDALIAERRAQGRYRSGMDRSWILLAGCALILAGMLLVML